MSRRKLVRRWYGMLAMGPLLLLLSFLPSVTYLGHWSSFIHMSAMSADEMEEHAGHCHIGASSCAEQPLPPDLSVTPALVHMVEPKLSLLELEGEQQLWQEHSVAPPKEPPRAAVLEPLSSIKEVT